MNLVQSHQAAWNPEAKTVESAKDGIQHADSEDLKHSHCNDLARADPKRCPPGTSWTRVILTTSHCPPRSSRFVLFSPHMTSLIYSSFKKVLNYYVLNAFLFHYCMGVNFNGQEVKYRVKITLIGLGKNTCGFFLDRNFGGVFAFLFPCGSRGG